MDRSRSLVVIGASFGLLVAGFALAAFVRRERLIEATERLEEVEGMIDRIEGAAAPTPAPKPARRKSAASARNGHVAKPVG